MELPWEFHLEALGANAESIQDAPRGQTVHKDPHPSTARSPPD